jgi:fimbrial chaperone protein
MPSPLSVLRHLLRLPALGRRLALALLAGLVATGAHAGQFTIQPTRLELGTPQRSGALTLRNESPAPLSFRIQGLRWTQDADGQERYSEAPELVYFPRLLTLPPGEAAVIRVGVRQPPEEIERTYRLFIEELAAPSQTALEGARVRVLMRFGAPVFVRAAAARRQLELTDFDLQGPQARWSVRNQGTGHELFKAVTLRGVDASGVEVFRQELLAERYLLAGAVRRFEAAVPAPLCGQFARLALVITTEQSEVRRDLDVGARPCP